MYFPPCMAHAEKYGLCPACALREVASLPLMLSYLLLRPRWNSQSRPDQATASPGEPEALFLDRVSFVPASSLGFLLMTAVAVASSQGHPMSLDLCFPICSLPGVSSQLLPLPNGLQSPASDPLKMQSPGHLPDNPLQPLFKLLLH